MGPRRGQRSSHDLALLPGEWPGRRALSLEYRADGRTRGLHVPELVRTCLGHAPPALPELDGVADVEEYLSGDVSRIVGRQIGHEWSHVVRRHRVGRLHR